MDLMTVVAGWGRNRMRCRFALMAVAITAGGLGLLPAAAPAAPKAERIQRTEVCFTVQVIGDPLDRQVSGTVFHKKNYKGGGTALLLQHGGVSDRKAWDGVAGAVPSMSAQLAEAGYVVFAIDRLGYAGSPYQPGSGWALTMDSYVEMTHDMVAQIREGTYRITDDTCEGGASSGRHADKVVLIGHSSGGFIGELYATRYDDIDGIVSMMFSSANSSSAFFEEVIVPDVVLGQWAQGKDYHWLFAVDDEGYSPNCEKWLFYAGGVSADVVEHICGPGYFGGEGPRLMPSGELSDTLGKVVSEEFRDRIADIGSTPVLLVFAEQDIMHPRNGLGNELQMWSEECNCDFDLLWQKNAGHAGVFHDSIAETTTGIIKWLRTGDVPEEPADPPTNGVPTAPCPASEQFPTLGLAGRHEDVAPPIPGTATSLNYRLDLSGSADVPDATLATLRLSLTWDDLSDFDMYLYDSADSTTPIGKSENFTVQTDRGIETILHFETAHCTDLRIEIINFGGLPTSNIDLDVTVSDLASQ